jgi:recombination protein RecA
MQTEAPRTQAEKLKASKEAIAGIEKDHGKGTVFTMGSRVGLDWPHIPSGIYGLDEEVFGIGGCPRGRIIEIYGPEAGGKTTLALQGIVAPAQRAGGLCAVIDAEHALDPNWMTKLTVNVNDLLICQPDNGEQALEVASSLISSQAYDVVLVDSVAALVPKAELEGDMGDAQMGLQARLMSQAMRKLNGAVARSNTTLIFINQIRDKLGVMFGSPETTTGGRALKFYASVRLDIRKIGALKEGDKVIGHTARIKAVKNKLAAPFREAEVDLMHSGGFNRNASLYDAAVLAGVLEKSGSWASFKGERIGQSREKSIDFLNEHEDFVTKITKELKEKKLVRAAA